MNVPTVRVAVLTALLVLPFLPGTAAPVGAASTDWRALLQEALDANRSTAFDGRVVIVAIDDSGPSIAEVRIARDPGGELRVSSGETWMVGLQESEGFVMRAGSLLTFGRDEALGFELDGLAAKYEITVGAGRPLDTGPATPVAFHERSGALRERIHVDDATGLVVRRETFTPDGDVERLVAFTSLRARTGAFEAMEPDGTARRGALAPISHDGLSILSDVGWAAPSELPGGYDLRAAYALSESEGASLHLVYGDGLYSLSVYQQRGRLDVGSLRGAVADHRGDVHLYRWPGLEPSRVVWSAEDLTFTAITDAPRDHLTAVVAAFPHEPAPSLARRMVRGMRRVADVLWPFA